ncbi:hypothetical protein [Bacillus swezeyi]|uniref:Uncharacterized protein n=1 Tax=Bacillus swezeyi TaxID=1925020 RepID=A0A5M8RLW9_9BACI|nr:hypothetical protein [Bacillus swezeyi]KAA6446922.1 hypothetical protein DX927_22995 [Bacillus swezeyi]KAA6471490.1 hypothetical protein DX928_23235 [Bacillus swezeyi]
MYQITIFTMEKKEKINDGLKKFGFSLIGNDFKLFVEEKHFTISPFKRQPEYGPFGYRIQSDLYAASLLSLFDHFISWINPKVNAVDLKIQKMINKNEVRKILAENPSMKQVDPRGCYQFKRVGIVMINGFIQFQVRGRNLKLADAIEEIEFTRDVINRVNFDLFSFHEADNN